MKKVLLILMCVGLMSVTNALTITNGDFEADNGGVPADISDVSGWYEPDNPTFWLSPWCKVAGVSHNGTAVLLMAGAPEAVSTDIDGAGQFGFVYQNIGTADGALEVKIAFEVGVPLDGPTAPPGRDQGITLTILESDGTFVPGEEVDILGAAGITLIDQKHKLYTNQIVGDVAYEVWTFDLSSAGSGDLFLRLNNYETVLDSWVPWLSVDNVSIVPEPATLALLALGSLAMLRKRKAA
jgi:hypothetical protein